MKIVIYHKESFMQEQCDEYLNKTRDNQSTELVN